MNGKIGPVLDEHLNGRTSSVGCGSCLAGVMQSRIITPMEMTVLWIGAGSAVIRILSSRYSFSWFLHLA